MKMKNILLIHGIVERLGLLFCQGNMLESGTWYRKGDDTPEQGTVGSQKGKKNQKKEVRRKSSGEPSPSM